MSLTAVSSQSTVQPNTTLSIERTTTPVQNVSMVRFTKDIVLTEDLFFEDRNAVVVIDRNINANGKKISIIARNVIMCPTAVLEVGELEVRTEGSSILLNITADQVHLYSQQHGALFNSISRIVWVQAEGNAKVAGINTFVDLRSHQASITEILDEVDAVGAPRFLLGGNQPSIEPAPPANN